MNPQPSMSTQETNLPPGWKRSHVNLHNLKTGESDRIDGWINPQGEFTLYGPDDPPPQPACKPTYETPKLSTGNRFF